MVTAVPVLSSVPSAVPLALECPGGNDAWQDVTEDSSSRLCQGQRNPCNTSVELGMVGDCGCMGLAVGSGLGP